MSHGLPTCSPFISVTPPWLSERWAVRPEEDPEDRKAQRWERRWPRRRPEDRRGQLPPRPRWPEHPISSESGHPPARAARPASHVTGRGRWPPCPAPLASSSSSPCVPSLRVTGNTTLEGQVTAEVAAFGDVTLLWLVFSQEHLDVTSREGRYAKVSPAPRVRETRCSSTARVRCVCHLSHSPFLSRCQGGVLAEKPLKTDFVSPFEFLVRVATQLFGAWRTASDDFLLQASQGSPRPHRQEDA